MSAPRRETAERRVDGTMDIKEIMKHLPHRYPFLLVDRVLSVEAFKRIEAIKNVTFNEPHFTGHFPDLPIMPGVLQIEAMAQTAGLLAVLSLGGIDQNTYLLGVDNAKFRKPVVPGDQMRITAEVLHQRGKVWKFAAQIHVGDVLVSEAEISAMTSDKEV